MTGRGMVPELSVATRMLQSLQVWAPWIWTGSSLGVVVLCWRLGRRVREARMALTHQLDDPGRSPELLLYRERLALGAGVFLVTMAAVGVSCNGVPGSGWNASVRMRRFLARPTNLACRRCRNYQWTRPTSADA